MWNSWSTVLKGMLRRAAPLLVNPAHKHNWLAEFCGNIRRHRANTIERARLAVATRAHLFEMAEAEGISFDLARRGVLYIYRDRAAFDTATKANAPLVEGGVERFAVSPREMKAIEPTSHVDFYGGFYTPDDALGDIHKFTCGLAEACERHGVDFRFNTVVDHVRSAGDGIAVDISSDAQGDNGDMTLADAVLVCAGVASRRFPAMLGDRVNIYPVKGNSVTVCLDDAVSQDAAPTVSLLDEDAKIVTSRLGRNRSVLPVWLNSTGRIAISVRIGCRPWSIGRPVCSRQCRPRRWSPGRGCCLMTPSMLPLTPSMPPRVGRGKRAGVFYNTGHGHLGWTLSAATADLAAHAIDGELGTPVRA